MVGAKLFVHSTLTMPPELILLRKSRVDNMSPAASEMKGIIMRKQ